MTLPRKLMRRKEHPGYARFLTFSCRRRLALFGNDSIKDALVERLPSLRRDHGLRLFAFVVMPEHVHLIVHAPPGASSIEVALRELKRPFAQSVIARWRELNAPILSKLREPNGTMRFWQPGGGYDRTLRDHDELREKFNYVHRNPAARGLVVRETDWKWSSARWWSGLRDGAIPMDPVR